MFLMQHKKCYGSIQYASFDTFKTNGRFFTPQTAIDVIISFRYVALKSIFQGNLQTNFGVSSQYIFFKCVKRSVLDEDTMVFLDFASKMVAQKNGSLKITLFQCHKLFWIYDIVEICTFSLSNDLFDHSNSCTKENPR